jgi:hypothetical protein
VVAALVVALAVVVTAVGESPQAANNNDKATSRIITKPNFFIYL